ncbi:hypothetical protein Poli38472_003552 [Pythium oligandrum]|uniref:Sodium/hydrogen exchanger n=1 Tax=Pythium oligandrum TaxID=41045 RepID=A0A8K1C7V9_PYTOL|nr:hypothetical protein Poli38472_003552 [Pythium oligandrum]|eukprot:TMW57627.1 hypothetical protein Poli38472_003552 [Pythium oligandrum]
MAPSTEPEMQQQWAGSELFLCALLQLLLVHIAYRIDRAKGAPYISAAAWAIAFGAAFGFILSLMSRKRACQAGLDSQILFFGLLPPIILEAGFNTQRKGFFSNFMVIALLALVGTIIATTVTGGLLYWIGQVIDSMTPLEPAEALLYGALISAIDPVATLVVLKKSHAPPVLFNLLFGESVINDAASIVIFGLFQNSVLDEDATPLTWRSSALFVLQLVGISIGSVFLAAVICYSSAYFLRHSDPALKQHPTYEISTILLSAYASYVAGQSLQLSGLLAVFFSGVFIRHYHMYNISHASAAAFGHLLSTIAFLAENFIYIYLGASLVAYSDIFAWDWVFIGVSVGVCVVARALNTFPLCMLANVCRTDKIPWRYMVVMWFSGLRGSIAFALALNVRTTGRTDNDAVMRASALVMVILSTVMCGAATGPLLRMLQLARDPLVPPSTHADSPGSLRHSQETTPLLPSEAASDRDAECAWIRTLWVNFDETHLKPIFGGNPRTSSVQNEI